MTERGRHVFLKCLLWGTFIPYVIFAGWCTHRWTKQAMEWAEKEEWLPAIFNMMYALYAAGATIMVAVAIQFEHRDSTRQRPR